MADKVKPLVSANLLAVDKWMPPLLDLMRADDTKSGEVADEAEDIFTTSDGVFEAMKKPDKGKFTKEFLELAHFCAEKRKLFYYKLLKAIIEERKTINWKENVESAITLIKSFETAVDIIRTENDNWWGKDRHLEDLETSEEIDKVFKYMLEVFSKEKIIRKVNKQLVELLTKCFEVGKDMHVVVAYSIGNNDMNWEGTERLYSALFKAIAKYIERDDIDLKDPHITQTRGVEAVFHNCFSESSSPSKYCKEVLEVWNICMKNDLESDENNELYSGYGAIVNSIATGYIMKHYGTKAVIKDFLPGVKDLLLSDNELLRQSACGIFCLIYSEGDLIAPYALDILNVFMEGGSTMRSMLGMTLKSLYVASPKKILSQFDALVEEFEDFPKDQRLYVYMMWEEVVKDHPKLLMPLIDTIMENVDDMQCSYFALAVLSPLSKLYPDKFEDKLEALVKVGDAIAHSLYQTCAIICNVGLKDQKQAKRCLKMLSDILKKSDNHWQVNILMQMKRLGMRNNNKAELAKYRAQIEKLKDSPLSGMSDCVQSIIDFLEGRSLEQLDDDIQETKENVQELDTRVTKTEDDVARIDETVAEQGQEIQNVKEDVKEQGERLDDLEEVVDETVEKVVEIDQKTIHNAPKWSRDVSKLLNPEHEYDWRYLAVRLGFTSEDIRNWALSPDPTMAILAEWYTIHKSSDATYAILTALEDMGRTDCTDIIEKALKEAEQMIPRAPVDLDGEKPPKVFLSYQWDHQPEVKVIKEHLEKAGFPCWMDIGQMGGGDQLFAKISEGMRASKVVLCMCTEKYSKSENCNKEVNLANLLNKPIFPILIDKMPWPPEGSMSMLFAQLLYIQFYNNKEYVRGEKFWEDAKFAELLSQISYYTVPDQEMITDEYRDWVPKIDDVPKEVTKAGGIKDTSTAKSTENEQATEDVPPDVFISYQWDKQPQIKKLYSRLTEQGFNCWLDINQMGGGDPLYTKIDKGIRNAKVVVSSVTAKYALSANCRREVSLTDCLKKPIIPLLMEEGCPWPPEGPMAMTFTQLLYIDFTNEKCQNMIDEEKYGELVQQLQEHVTPMEKSEAPKDNEEPQVTPVETSEAFKDEEPQVTPMEKPEAPKDEEESKSGHEEPTKSPNQNGSDQKPSNGTEPQESPKTSNQNGSNSMPSNGTSGNDGQPANNGTPGDNGQRANAKKKSKTCAVL